MNDIVFLDNNDPELQRAWKLVDSDPIAEDPDSGETWQYMGTVMRPASGPASHQFRHRNHPKTQKRENRNIPVDLKWMMEQIRKSKEVQCEQCGKMRDPDKACWWCGADITDKYKLEQEFLDPYMKLKPAGNGWYSYDATSEIKVHYKLFKMRLDDLPDDIRKRLDPSKKVVPVMATVQSEVVPEESEVYISGSIHLLPNQVGAKGEYIGGEGITTFNEEHGKLGTVKSDKYIEMVDKWIKQKRSIAGGNMLTKLFKLATEMDRKGLYTEADEIDQAIQLLAERAGLNLEDLVSLANDLDTNGYVGAANVVDALISEAAKKKTKYKAWKGKGEKPPKGAEHKAPKAWWDEQAAKVKKKNPEYSKKRVSEIVGDIWDNQLSDAKRQSIYKRHGKTKSPNK